MAELVTPTKITESGRIKRGRRPSGIEQSKCAYRRILPKPVDNATQVHDETRERVLPKSLKSSQQEADHILNKIGIRNDKLVQEAERPISKSDKIKLQKALETSQTDEIANAIKEVKPLWCQLKIMYLKDIKEQSASLCKKGDAASVLRTGSKSYSHIKDFKWTLVLNEMLEKAPDAADVLATISIAKPVKTEKSCDSIVPPLCMSWAVLMNIRNTELSLVQKTVTCMLGVSGCNKMTMRRFNALKLCQSHQNWLRCMDDISANLSQTVKEELNHSKKPRLIFDNLDFRVKSGELLKGIKNTDRHWMAQYLTFDRFETSNLDNSHPLGDLKQEDIDIYLLDDDEQSKIKSEYIVLVGRIVTKYISWMSSLEKSILKHIPHKYSEEMASKSVVIGLPVKPYDQKKHSDVIQYLDSVQTFIEQISESEENTDDSENTLIQLPLGGDLLGRERVTGAKKLRNGCDEPKEQFENIVEVSEYWHAKQSLLKLCWKHLYNQSSAREPGTLYFFRNLHGRSNVKAKVTQNYAAAEGLLIHLATAHIISAFMHYSGMSSLDARPTKVKEPPINSISNESYINDIIGGFVTNYCLFEPDIDKLFRKQKEKEQEQINQQAQVMQQGSIVFLLAKKDDGNYEFEAIGFNVGSDDSQLLCHVVQVLRAGATQYQSEDLIKESTIVRWPKALVAFNPQKKDTEEKPSEDIDLAKDEDYKHNYGLWIIQFGLLIMQMNDTEKEGDGERALRNNKLLLLMFRTGKYGKYAFEMLRMISKVKCQMTPQVAERTIHGRFVNWKGGQGKNCANDLKQEHMVKFTKKLLKGMGAQKTEKAIERATGAAGGLKYITENFDEVTKITPQSTAHTYKNAESDILNMVSILNTEKVFHKIPNRAHASFPKLPQSILEMIDIVKMSKWMKRCKSKLAKNPDIPWDNCASADSDGNEESDDDSMIDTDDDYDD